MPGHVGRVGVAIRLGLLAAALPAVIAGLALVIWWVSVRSNTSKTIPGIHAQPFASVTELLQTAHEHGFECTAVERLNAAGDPEPPDVDLSTSPSIRCRTNGRLVYIFIYEANRQRVDAYKRGRINHVLCPLSHAGAWTSFVGPNWRIASPLTGAATDLSRTLGRGVEDQDVSCVFTK